jgi:hypothetical protein
MHIYSITLKYCKWFHTTGKPLSTETVAKYTTFCVGGFCGTNTTANDKGANFVIGNSILIPDFTAFDVQLDRKDTSRKLRSELGHKDRIEMK